MLKRKTSLLKQKTIKSTVAELKHVRFDESARDKETAVIKMEESNDSKKGKCRKRWRRRGLVTQRSRRKKRKLTHKLENHGSLQYQDGNDSITASTEEVVAIQRDMREWVELCCIPRPLLRALWDLKFYQPTEIQKRTIPLVAMGDNDLIGAAETVSLVYILYSSVTKHIHLNISTRSEYVLTSELRPVTRCTYI